MVVGAFGATRVAIGVVLAIAPDRVMRPTAGPDAALMTRSFAVRETVLGVGGLLAAAAARRHPSGVPLWAGLGALTDAGDLWAALAGLPDAGASAGVPALVAALGLAAELWAFRRASKAAR
jgi:hypothetical protein